MAHRTVATCSAPLNLFASCVQLRQLDGPSRLSLRGDAIGRNLGAVVDIGGKKIMLTKIGSRANSAKNSLRVCALVFCVLALASLALTGCSGLVESATPSKSSDGGTTPGITSLSPTSGLIGTSVTIAGDGREAVRAAEGERFDLIIMDLQMPVMDGYEATRQLRERLGLDTPILAMTAGATQGGRKRCLEAGMNDYMLKPFEIGDFYSRITHLLKGTIGLTA